MPFVAILGAGPLGGALAYTLAVRSRFDEVRLIDPEKTLAAGKALDILQSGPVDGFSTRVTGHASLDAAQGAWTLVLADPIQADPVAHLGALHKQSPAALLVAADATHQAAIARAVATGAVSPDRLIGSAPQAFASASRALLALDVDIAASAVAVSVASAIAEPGHPAVPPCRVDWGRTSIDGVAAEPSLTREHRARLDRRLAAAWPPAALTLAAAAAQIAEAGWFGSRRRFAAWWVTDGGASLPGVRSLRIAPGGRVLASEP